MDNRQDIRKMCRPQALQEMPSQQPVFPDTRRNNSGPKNQTLVSQLAKMDGELQAMKSERARRRRRKDSGNRKHGLLKRMFGG